MSRSVLRLACLLSLLPLLVLSSCTQQPVGEQAVGSAVPGVALHGSVHGGQTPITGADVYLFAAGTSGYNSLASSLLNTSDMGVSTDGNGLGYVPTDSSGNWSISGDYTCPNASSPVYLVAYGGNPGLSSGTNGGIGLMAALGPCGNLTSSTFVVVNEVTTIASVYALAQFANSLTDSIATSSTNILGLTNAFANVPNMVNLTTGTAYATTAASGSSGTLPQATINTLANILASCVNTNGATSACSNLYTDTTPPAGTAPTNTVQAALNIALHPLNNVTALYGLVSATGPFQPSLSSAPTDWTIAIDYYFSGELSGDVVIDSKGNAWFPSYNYFLNKMSSLGVPATGSPFSSGFQGVVEQGGAIDLSDNVWWASRETAAQLYKYSSTGTLITSLLPITTSGGDIDAVAVDSGSNVWATSVGYSTTLETDISYLYKFDTNGNAVTGFPVTGGGGLAYPLEFGLAIDSSGDAIVTVNCAVDGCNKNTTQIQGMAEFNNAGSPLTTNVNAIACTYSQPLWLTIDNQGNYWVTGTFGGTGCLSGTQDSILIKVSSSGAVLKVANPNYPTGGRTVIDGKNNIWSIDGEGHGYLIELDTNGNLLSTGAGPVTLGDDGTSYGYADTTVQNNARNIAIDSSGNMWEAQQTGNLYEFIGLAPPVMTPIAAAAANNKIGALP